MGRVEAVYGGAASGFALPDGSAVRSAIRKQELAGRAVVGRDGLPGDESVDKNHGGPNRALHAFPVEHYARLESLVGLAPEWKQRVKALHARARRGEGPRATS